jgi:hypothetical protein
MVIIVSAVVFFAPNFSVLFLEKSLDLICYAIFFFFKDQDNQKKNPESPLQANNSIISNNNQMNQQLSAGGGYMGNSKIQGSGSNVNSYELPEPPIPVSEIGPIPPPPMFSTPSPTLIAGRPHGPAVLGLSHHEYDYDGNIYIVCSMKI